MSQTQQPAPTAEHARLAESPRMADPWRRWGPYVAGRQWGTVREDYSADGDAWNAFPFDQARSRAYRWGEDGLAGLCDLGGFLHVAPALWNRHDAILKERLFGLTNAEGNHGEDVKEYWWPLEATPTHSWARWLYRYPQAAFPYERLRAENAARSRTEREFELADTGVLDGNRFFDVVVTHAKASPQDVCIEIAATNHGPDPAPLDLLGQVWLRNTWSWGLGDAPRHRRGTIRTMGPEELEVGGLRAVCCDHPLLGRRYLSCEGEAAVLVCENETDARALFGAGTNPSRFTKDGIDRYLVGGDVHAAAVDGTGTKAAFVRRFDAVAPGATVTMRLRLSTATPGENTFDESFEAVLTDRAAEAREFYDHVLAGAPEVDRRIAERAFAGLLWGRQLYLYDVAQWLSGDPVLPAPPERSGPGARNAAWRHVDLGHVISMPDEWEYPWFAAWDLAFHAVCLAHVDPAFAKNQLVLMCREWAMHPDGQLPAYEWAFGDVNPPVHAWAAWMVYQIDGSADRTFLVRIYSKLLLNFSWWVNRKDADGSNLFEGGFLGMDNIGLFNRSAPLPAGFRLEQSDATAWMAFHCHQMLQIGLELSRADDAWNDSATTFFQHFTAIARAMGEFGTDGVSLWDETDGFFYDVLHQPDGTARPLRVASMVGLLPLLGVTELPEWVSTHSPDLAARMHWLRANRPEVVEPLLIARGPEGTSALASLVDERRLRRILPRVFDPDQFWSDHGVRSLSRAVGETWATDATGASVSIRYEPGESTTPMFGGNSNWRGPVWFPVNVLLADKLQAYGRYFGSALTVQVPTGSGPEMDLCRAAEALEEGLISLFRPGPDGAPRPADGARVEASEDPLWREHPTFSEYFDGDTGEGLGATHQTGWTALVAHLVARRAERSRQDGVGGVSTPPREGGVGGVSTTGADGAR